MPSADPMGPAQPVAAKPSTLAAPATPDRNKRRTWFGLVTPTRKDQRRTATLSHQPQPAAAPTPTTPSNSNGLEELDATPDAKAINKTPVQNQRQWNDEDQLGSERDWDSDQDGTVRYKGSRIKANSEDEPIRMKDMATLATLTRNNTVKPKPSFSRRIFSRGATDRDTLPADFLSPSKGQMPTSVISPSKVPQRSSSVTSSSIPVETNPNPPPPPTKLDLERSPMPKPLPDVPPFSNGFNRGPTLNTDIAGPADIVITPSSPLEEDPFEHIFGLGPSAPNRSMSAPVSPTPTMHTALTSHGILGGSSSAGTSPGIPSPLSRTPDIEQSALGLGLPRSHSPHSRGSSPGPRVAVSSPLPQNPSPKVAFDEEQDHPTSKPGSSKTRPRSLSLMFSKSGGEVTDDEDSGTSKFSWLGVGKVIRRRRSDMKLMRKRSGILTDNEMSNDSSPMDTTPNGGERTPEHRSEDTNRSRSPAPEVVLSDPFRRIAPSRSPEPPQNAVRQENGSQEVGPTDPVPEHVPVKPEPVMIPVRNGPRPQFSMIRPASSDSFASTSEQEFYPAQEWSDSSIAESPMNEIDLTAAQAGADWLMTKPSSAASPLGSLPEGSMAPPITTTVADASPVPDVVTPSTSMPPRHGRGRSLSDAARTSIPEDPGLLSPDGAPVRPPLSSRSSSSNSAVLGKMRGVFTKSSRPRSNSLLRYTGSGTSADEREDGRQTPHSRPGSASSSFAPSPALPPVRIRPEDVPQVSTLALQSGDDGRRIILTETPPRSPRSSYAASVTSYQTQSTVQTAQSNRRSATDNLMPVTNGRNRRARASTIASGAISWHGSTFGGSTPALVAPPPTSFSPTSPGGLQRTGSLRRLSQGLFRGSGPSSPKPQGAFPLPPRPVTPTIALNDEIPQSMGTPGRSSSGDVSLQGRSSTPQLTEKERKERDAELHPRPGESAEDWLERLESVSRKEVAGLLAESADPFHAGALAEYMRRFDFTHIPLDVALRRLLMVMSLPKETQQIDRVVEAFSKRYDECEANLFGSTDNAYVLAFSMMMLHTDAFNRHNKNKMTKADYVKNTRLDGVSPTVLEAFFDNITFTPFVFIDDDEEAALAAAGMAPSSSSRPNHSGKIDVYDLIVGGQLGSLRVDVERYIPPDSPFSCMGTRQFLDVDRLQKAFANAHPLQFVKSRPRRKSLTLTGVVERPTTPVPKEEIATIKITKVGLLGRREDHLHGNSRRAIRRGWKNWSVVLTGAQLLFFKDTIWALTLVEKIRSANGESQAAQTTAFQPDEVMSVKDCVAIYDRSYAATPYTFRLLMPGGNSYLLQASDEHQMNEWLTLINYASTFKTAGIRMRPLGMDGDKAVLAGNAAAESHRRDLAAGVGSVVDLLRSAESSNYTRAVVFAESETPEPLAPKPRALRRVGSVRATPTVDIRGANDMVVGGSEQFDAVMGSVREELLRVTSPVPPSSDGPTRADRRRALIESKIGELKLLAEPVQAALQADLRLARNLALLTPFQRATKERIEAALPELSDRIRADRMELSKLHLWITMLLKDQEREAREWSWAKSVALQAAEKHLVKTKSGRRNTVDILGVPELSLPDADDEEHELELRVASPIPFPEREDVAIGALAAGAAGAGAVGVGVAGTSGAGLTTGLAAQGHGLGLPHPAPQYPSYSVPLKDAEPASPRSPRSPGSERMSQISQGSAGGSGSEYMSARSSMLSFEAELDKTFGPRSPSLSLSPSKFKNKAQAQAHTQAMLTGAPIPTSPPAVPQSLANLQLGYTSHHHLSEPTRHSAQWLPDEPADSALPHTPSNPSNLSNPSSQAHTPSQQRQEFPGDRDSELLKPEDPREQAEHWRHTRAASKVSLAKLPRSSIGELTERIRRDIS
ncbi:ARF guanyl-nucleotide exchange factor [Trichosporon asahii var. asahii CBS 2479]|uniref:ARF guanyl-nucleotide exchange factor n=1 Tax=Trichosporon asahii var. asahii (strain ATCC 90039 / CBS 2479 / JCM 2466 / KCTC 7840 / NBRC 103889/ NCYC 2677 / UAMH 7654) TaxID=1186058 RepID=J5TKF8_TRIAS|nr:ARF guanyl-nucleotide exchange factor [Trichosporon asahii var. asahii CBS 2479]EJT51351.1 ARF guanyl-nucleotide exchange factor [Trichosporon asahii var. asahii CBS 2479]